MKMSDAVPRVCRIVARDTPTSVNEKIVDAACMHLVMNPGQFDVLVMPNLSAISCRTCARASWAGWASSGRPTWGGRIGVFGRCTARAPGMRADIANPTALLLSAVLMLRHIGETPAERVGRVVTRADGRRGQDARSRQHRLDCGLRRRSAHSGKPGP